MDIIFTKEYMNRKRQEHGLPKLKYVREVIVHDLSDSKFNDRNCYMGTLHSETEEYNWFSSGFDMLDDYSIHINKTRFVYWDISIPHKMEDINKSLYPGFSKDLIEIYHTNKIINTTKIYIE